VLLDAALASHASRVCCATESPFGATPLLILLTKFRRLRSELVLMRDVPVTRTPKRRR
jgi:hypothetical protein